MDIARSYHAAWTGGDFDAAIGLLADDLETDVPIHTYPSKDDFASALVRFGGAATEVRLISVLEGGDTDACLIYDMDLPEIGTLRVAEHLVMRDGRIAVVRHIHDTA